MTVAHNRPDIILVEKAIQKLTIIDAVPSDFNVQSELECLEVSGPRI